MKNTTTIIRNARESTVTIITTSGSRFNFTGKYEVREVEGQTQVVLLRREQKKGPKVVLVKPTENVLGVVVR